MRMHVPPLKRTIPDFMTNDQPVVMVIDDEAEIVSALARLLSSAGYLVHCCHDYESAVATVRACTPDLILSDINLGGQSGLWLCEQIKREERLGQIPVIFLSGAQIPDIVRRAREAGGVYFLRKPFDPQVLLELVDKALWMPHLVDALGKC
jgi:CheY-like chemotaxis protein